MVQVFKCSSADAHVKLKFTVLENRALTVTWICEENKKGIKLHKCLIQKLYIKKVLTEVLATFFFLNVQKSFHTQRLEFFLTLTVLHLNFVVTCLIDWNPILDLLVLYSYFYKCVDSIAGICIKCALNLNLQSTLK